MKFFTIKPEKNKMGILYNFEEERLEAVMPEPSILIDSEYFLQILAQFLALLSTICLAGLYTLRSNDEGKQTIN